MCIRDRRETASTWCAFGAASADVLHIHERVDMQASPFDAERINRNLDTLEKAARAQFAKESIAKPCLLYTSRCV